MKKRPPLYDRRRLILMLGLLLCAGFMATSLLSYFVSRDSIRSSIVDLELPLTSDNIYTEIQKDLVRPIFVSSMMASDTFLRDWVIHGEKNVDQMTRYLKEVQERYGAFTSFYVSDKTGVYYQSHGVLKQVKPNEPRDAWYYRVRLMDVPYEINVDPDLANGDQLTIFINYRVFDYDKHFIGAAGVGLTVDAVRNFIVDYQKRYQRSIYFVDTKGQIVLFGNHSGRSATSLQEMDGLRNLAPSILSSKTGSYRYRGDGHDHLLNVRFIPELNWYLFVEKREDEALADIRQTLYLNLALCLGITGLVLFITRLALNRYQNRLEEMAVTDKLTGLYNRQAFDLLVEQAMAEHRRNPNPLSILMVDIDHFKQVNDRYGHQQGDAILRSLSPVLRDCLRQSDLAFRWGGEEYLVLLKGDTQRDAVGVAEKLRESIAAHVFTLGDAEPGAQISITLSIGVAEYREGETMETLIARADGCLYLAKAAGRNRVVVAESADDKPAH
ncbi:MAG TPA: diguanylate cyclase [Rhodocyclaceae bacterium]|jgi:diguanylate cyclase (GGDEF)-like protein